VLRSFVWADQDDRLALLDRAIATVRRDPPDLCRADYVESLDRAARVAPLGWVSAGRPLVDGMTAWGMDVRLLPGPRRVVAHADFHGAWLDWFPASA